MLSTSGIIEIDPEKLKIMTESKRPLDVVLENTNARKNFMLMCKQSDKTIECEEHQRSPDFHYFKRCMEENVLPLPAISKINDASLMLVGYKLNEGLSKALHYGIEKYEGKIKNIVFENNGIKDEMLGYILDSFIEKYEEIESVCISKNDFGALTSSKLSELVEKAYRLKELKVDNCKVHGTSMEDFINSMKNGCNLQKIKLTHLGLNQLSVESICKILAENSNLNELDLSWNNLLSNSMNQIMTELDANRTLKYLNISWNQIKGMNAKLNKEIITKLGNFITENKNLVHLDLVSINLQGNDLKKIGKLISMSSSLLGFHLCGNPMTPKQNRYLKKCLRIPIDDESELKSFEIEPYGNNQSDEEIKAFKKSTTQDMSSLLNGIKTKFIK